MGRLILSDYILLINTISSNIKLIKGMSGSHECDNCEYDIKACTVQILDAINKLGFDFIKR